MPNFEYIAINSSGQSVRGSMTVAQKADVAAKLRQQGLFLVSCKTEALAPPELLSRSPLKGSDSARKSFTPPRGHISLKELAVLTRQISISLKAGMSFVVALQRMVPRAKNPLTAFIVGNVLDDVLSGKKFSEALARHPSVFKPIYVSLVAAGEAGGNLPEALNRVADILEKEMDLNAKIKSAMVYPFTIAFVAMLVVMGMMMFVVPTFVRVFHDMDTPLPLPTRMLVAISGFFRHGGFLLPIACAGILIGLQRYRLRNERFRCWWDEKLLEIPLFGRLMTLEIVTRFIRTFASLLDNGVVALQAISVARQVVQNRSIEKVIDDLYASVQQGNGFSVVLYNSKYFPELVSDMVATGESTGTIPEVLNKVADYYDAEVTAAVRDTVTILEPLMIMVMAIIVGVIIAGLMLPMFGISNGING